MNAVSNPWRLSVSSELDAVGFPAKETEARGPRCLDLLMTVLSLADSETVAGGGALIEPVSSQFKNL